VIGTIIVAGARFGVGLNLESERSEPSDLRRGQDALASNAPPAPRYVSILQFET
jgi:hypothetical protein